MKAFRGFTLIELIVVMGILAILATIVVIAVNPARQFATSRNAKRASDTRAIAHALQQHAAANNGLMDSSITSLPKTIGTTVGSTFVDLTNLLVPNYLSSIPFDPSGGSASDTKYRVYIDSQGQPVVSVVGELGKVVSSDGVFSPKQIPGLLLWLKADAGTYQTVSGSPAVANNDPVGEWRDQSGNNNHLSQSTAGLRPLLKINTQNGLPTVLFDSVDDGMTAASMPLTQPFSLFYAGEVGSLAGSNQSLMSGNPTTSNVWYVGSTGQLVLSNGVTLIGSGGITTNSFFSAGAVANGASSSLILNSGNAVTGNAGTNNWDGFGIRSAVSSWPGGDKGEVMIFNRALSTAEITSLMTYLKSRWGTP